MPGLTIPVSQTGAKHNTMVPVVEMGLKLTSTPTKGFDFWLGYDFLEFINGLVGQTFVGSNGNFSEQQTRQNVAFAGSKLGIRWRFL